MSVAGIVLAAGSSRRLGRPKQNVILGGETLLQRAIRAAHQAGLSPVFVVTQAPDGLAEALQADGCVIVHNREAEEGIASSIRVGMSEAEACDEIEGVVVMACDQPFTRPEHLRALVAEPGTVTGSGYANRTGVPAYFPRRSFASLRALKGNAGARDLLQQARVVQAEELAMDVDTEEDVARAAQILERSE